jgi:adenylate kinase
MIFVCGVSASGKSHAVSLFAATDPSYVHVKGSRILEECGQPIRNLALEDAVQNQSVLHRELLNRGLTTSRHILDGHITIETSSGFYVVPDWFFDAMKLDHLICVLDDPSSIAARLHQKGISCSTDAVDAHQKFERSSAMAQAGSLGCSYTELAASDLEGFARAISG